MQLETLLVVVLHSKAQIRGAYVTLRLSNDHVRMRKTAVRDRLHLIS